MNDVAVLIVGAGPTGLTLACDLARRGVACRIVERSGSPAVGSRGRGLQPRTQEVFDDLGIIERVRAAGGDYPDIRAHRGEDVVWEGRMIEHREPTPDVPHPNPWMLPQWRTTQLLRDRLAEFGGSHVEFGTELTGFEQDADGVLATLVHDGVPELVRVGYLVGADGGHSAVRRTLGVGFEGETFDTHRMLVADVTVDGLSRSHWHVWPETESRTFRVGLCPLPGTDSFQFTAPVHGEATPELTLAALQKTLDAATGRTDITLLDSSWITLFRANIRMVDRYRVGRVFLAGDAAHVHSPAGGQGLNTGVQDAYNLGWKLAAVLAGAPAELLDSYEAERLPVAAAVLGISSTLHHKAVNREPDAHRRDDPALQQLGLTYRGGPLAREERAEPGSVLAGDRAPDAPCLAADGSPLRLFDLFRGPHFTLLAFGSRHADAVAEVAARHPKLVRGHVIAPSGDVVDAEGHAGRAYCVAPGTSAVLLIRPDGYIGWAGDTATDGRLDAYLDGLVSSVG
ncbi:FAD-dependent oxidoreductase [Solihabitans fulvus]|uniref:FAD-dependent oxidoreductase n=1 Tax=Solihabitans fulvus TaxID=1892852 RepID=A0A5B2WYF4_9PSEU|nr:FAD-dependent oxidoreductase [Solihabitans fulvus]KAA2254947.1 FAD-dependent oxidoreductase [Solihabitans fulvus]